MVLNKLWRQLYMEKYINRKKSEGEGEVYNTLHLPIKAFHQLSHSLNSYNLICFFHIIKQIR